MANGFLIGEPFLGRIRSAVDAHEGYIRKEEPYAIRARIESSQVTQRPPNSILIRNDSGYAVPWLGVLQISGFVTSPAGGSLDGTDAASERAREFVSSPVMTGVVPTGDSQAPFVVCMQPLAIGETGKAAVGGAFACRVLVLKSEHRFAHGKAGDVTQLQSALCGPVRILQSTGVGQNAWALGAM